MLEWQSFLFCVSCFFALPASSALGTFLPLKIRCPLRHSIQWLALLHLTLLLVGGRILSLQVNLHELMKQQNNSSSPHTETLVWKPSLVVARCARNMANILPQVLSTTHHVTEGFEHHWVFIYTDYNHDDTLTVLESCNQLTPFQGKDEVIHETGISQFQTVCLANGWNALLRWIQQLNEETPVQYMLMLDMDKVTLELKFIEECLQLPSGWGGCCTNQ